MELKVEPLKALEEIRRLPKAQDMADLQARVDYLLRENRELKTQVEELKGKIETMEVELVAAQKEWDEVTAINRTFWYFIKNPGDVINKVKLYDEETL